MQNRSLRVGTFTRSLLIHLAREDGSLEQAGLNVEETSVVSSPAQFRSLEEGEFDVVFTSPDNVLAYRFLKQNPLGRLLPVQILSAVDRGLGLSLCLAPSIGTAEGVRDRVVGVDVAQSGFAFVAYALLERAGLHPQDYTVAALGSTPRRCAALISGECAATVLNAGNELRAVGAGCTFVSSVGDLGPYLGTVIASLTTHDPGNEELASRFTSVMRSTVGDVLSGAKERQVVDAAMELLGLSEAEAQAHYACLLDPSTGFIADGTVDRASVETLLELRRSYLSVPELDSIAAMLSSVVATGALG